MAVKRCTVCSNPVVTEHRYGDPMTVDGCPICTPADIELDEDEVEVDDDPVE